MRRPKKQIWKSGDCFLIPLLDGSYLMGQVLNAEPHLLNSLSCALFDQRSDGQTWPDPDLRRMFSLLFTTRDLLDSGDWKVVTNTPIELPRKRLPYEDLRSSGFIGAKVIGSRIVAEFANAYCALAPWNDWHDPNYLDRLLLSPDLKPKTLVFKA